MSDTDADDAWRERAACRGYPLRWWFPVSRRGRRPDRHLVIVSELERAQALELCATCPVRDDCLDYAIRYDEVGIWGGTTDRERRRIRRSRAAQGDSLEPRLERDLLPRATRYSSGRAEYLEPCGTEAAYARHSRQGETPCAYCRAAHARAVYGRAAMRSPE